MINKAAVAQTSPVQQMVAAAGNPTLWSISNINPSPHHHPFLVAPPPHHHQLTPWNHSIQEPPDQPWSQFLLGGLVDEDGKAGLRDTKNLENWEQKFLDQTSDQFQAAKLPPDHSWSHQMLMSAASSPKSCITTTLSSSNNAFEFSPKSSDLKNQHQDLSSECNSKDTGGAAKKARIQSSATQSTFKVRKEKLGDRITALHQIVSPFGKTDTASVLLEAIGYIRFLQSQIEALSLPYLANGSSATRQTAPPKKESNEETKMDLRSRGLCLVPIACTVDVGSDINGADYWASAFGANFG